MKITATVRSALHKALDAFCDALEQEQPTARRTIVRLPAQPSAESTPDELERAREALRRKTGAR